MIKSCKMLLTRVHSYIMTYSDKLITIMTIRNLLLLIILISLIVLAVYNYNAGRNLNLKANTNNSQFKECRKIANVSECNSVVEELNGK